MRYFTPGTSTPKSLFVPLPLEFMAGKLEAEQLGYDTALAAIDTAGEKLTLNRLQSQEKPAQELLNSYYEKFNKVADEIETTGNYRGSARNITSLINEWTNNPTKKLLEYNLEQYNTYLEDKQAQKAEGTYGYWNDFGASWEPIKADGTPNIFNYTGLPMAQEHTVGAKTFMGKVAPEGVLGETEVPNDALGAYVTTKYGATGVNATKLWNLSASKAYDFIATDKAGMDWATKYKYDNPDTWATPIYDAAGALVGNELLEEATYLLYNANKEQIGEIGQEGTSYTDYAEWKAKKLGILGGKQVEPGMDLENVSFDFPDELFTEVHATPVDLTGVVYVPAIEATDAEGNAAGVAGLKAGWYKDGVYVKDQNTGIIADLDETQEAVLNNVAKYLGKTALWNALKVKKGNTGALNTEERALLTKLQTAATYLNSDKRTGISVVAPKDGKYTELPLVPKGAAFWTEEYGYVSGEDAQKWINDLNTAQARGDIKIYDSGDLTPENDLYMQTADKRFTYGKRISIVTDTKTEEAYMALPTSYTLEEDRTNMELKELIGEVSQALKLAPGVAVSLKDVDASFGPNWKGILDIDGVYTLTDGTKKASGASLSSAFSTLNSSLKVIY